MVHDAFELRVGSRSVLLDHEPDSSDVELIDALDPGCVVFNLMIENADPLDRAPLGCAYPYSSDAILEDDAAAGRCVEVATKNRLVKAVTFEYGAAWLD